ncbi:polygalacturonase inhibitor-like [Forsythia ovata]|uniref:Polygalacturonase inhibitor-like n=1 Tax=Forsythia ovata TaxID=205694 RepID=A0ABD1NVW6_9LAMI
MKHNLSSLSEQWRVPVYGGTQSKEIRRDRDREHGGGDGVGNDLSFNDLTGSIPPELSLLQNLDALYLVWNKLTGNISESFGKFSRKVPDLYLSHNKLTGSVRRKIQCKL